MKEGGTTRQAESSALGIHDNLVSGNHQGWSHWRTMPRGMGGPQIILDIYIYRIAQKQ